ncbi:MAG: extracellular solute-binding protein [Propionibacteriaceae bacterium]|nr:extracellular solute-binding protein [Propionibacteriaceae bacterium]
MRLHVKATLAVALAATTLLTTACGGGGGTPPATDTSSSAPSTDTAAPPASVTMTWWHNANTDPGLSFWADQATAFEAANPGVTINIQPYQNEDLRAKLKTVFSSDQAPTIFQQWGGGELADQVKAGYVQDITTSAADAIAALGGPGAISGWTVNGKVYGLPYTGGIEGIWYNKDLFTQAGITSTPTTLDELNADIVKLKAAKITPIAVGGQDAWPAAHWYFNFALRACSQQVMNDTVTSLQFTDPCWKQAAQNLADFTKTNPFNDGWSTTSAQQGAGSSSGMLANGQAAMELMGAWEPGVVGGLAPDKTIPAFLDWFPFPAVSGGNGDPTAAMVGGDGMSCLSSAPDACAQFLSYIVSTPVQTAYATTTNSIPSNPAAASGLNDPSLQKVASAAKDCAYTMLWLDTSYGSNVGGAINNNVVALMMGQTDPDGFIKAVQTAADGG